MPAQTSGSFALTWVSFPVQGGLPLQLPKHLDTPEELEPLKEALHRAHRRVQSSAQIREDLEGEVSRHHLHACRHGDLCRCLHTLRRCILGAWYHRGANREVSNVQVCHSLSLQTRRLGNAMNSVKASRDDICTGSPHFLRRLATCTTVMAFRVTASFSSSRSLWGLLPP